MDDMIQAERLTEYNPNIRTASKGISRGSCQSPTSSSSDARYFDQGRFVGCNPWRQEIKTIQCVTKCKANAALAAANRYIM